MVLKRHHTMYVYFCWYKCEIQATTVTQVLIIPCLVVVISSVVVGLMCDI